jgi:hypothetical protein
MANFGIGNPFWQYSMPEYELEGLWACNMIDDDDVAKVDSFMPLGFDKYIQSVSIPQLSLDYETTNYGLMKFKEKSPYDDVTMTFYDDSEGSCMAFFQEWMFNIYDENRCALRPRWRYHTKTINLAYYRQFYSTITTSTFYKMVKCLPKSISEISAEEDGGERKTFSVTIATQRVYTSTPKSLYRGDANLLGDVFFM